METNSFLKNEKKKKRNKQPPPLLSTFSLSFSSILSLYTLSLLCLQLHSLLTSFHTFLLFFSSLFLSIVVSSPLSLSLLRPDGSYLFSVSFPLSSLLYLSSLFPFFPQNFKEIFRFSLSLSLLSVLSLMHPLSPLSLSLSLRFTSLLSFTLKKRKKIHSSSIFRDRSKILHREREKEKKERTRRIRYPVSGATSLN